MKVKVKNKKLRLFSTSEPQKVKKALSNFWFTGPTKPPTKLLGSRKRRYRKALRRLFTSIGRPKVAVAVPSSKTYSFRRNTASSKYCAMRRSSEVASISRCNGSAIPIAPSTRRGSPKPNSKPLPVPPWMNTGKA